MYRVDTGRCSSNSKRLAPLLATAVALAYALPARAHQASISYSRVTVDDDHTEVVYRLQINAVDAAEPLGLASDVLPTDEQLSGGAERMFDYVLERVAVITDGRRCPIERLGSRLLRQNDRFAELTWRVRCSEPFNSLAIEYDLFFDLDPLHTGNLVVNVPGEDPAVAPLREGRARFVWGDLGAGPPSSLGAFLQSGIEHILYGYDHVAFLLGLFLVVAVARGPTRTWRSRTVGGAVKYTAAIVTAFTIAHSITLIAAALGAISVASRIVETLIAASILYIAVENIVRPEVRYRWVLVFAFGLVHGLGFASVLSHLLPPEHVVVPLLAFNLGVEVGQLALVVVLIPMLCLLANRVLGADRYRKLVVVAGSAAIGLLGALWLFQRLFEVEVLGP